MDSELGSDGDLYLLEYDGTAFEIHKQSDGLTLIHSCFAGVEYMLLKDDFSLKGTWDVCDGPALFFSRK